MPSTIANTLDAAVLKPEMTRDEALEAIREAIGYGVRTVCVRPCDIDLAKTLTMNTSTGVCVVLGFPHGDQLSASKADEAARYVALGVEEIDMVANYGWIRSGLWEEVEKDISAVVEVTRPANVPLKVIFETAQLTDEQIALATDSAIRAGADFVKTSTGFGGRGASDNDIRIMLESAAGRAQVKASGGIRTRAEAENFLAMGATRLGVGSASCAALCSEVPGIEPQLAPVSY